MGAQSIGLAVQNPGNFLGKSKTSEAVKWIIRYEDFVGRIKMAKNGA